MPAQQVLEMVTVEAARILNLEAGSLRPGLAADLVLIDLRRTNLIPTRASNVVENLVWASDGSEARFVVAGGRVGKDDYRLKTLDAEEISDKILRLSEHLEAYKAEIGSLSGTGAQDA